MSTHTDIPDDEELRREISELIKKSERGLSFSEYMQLALYHPVLGYYSRAPEIGKKGDFYTSVSVGACFGKLLGRQLLQIREQLAGTGEFAVYEQGAHSGQLASDILREAPGLRYRIVEPSEKLQALQRELLGAAVEIEPSLAAHAPVDSGAYLANELLDALPVKRVRFEGGAWQELRVVLGEHGAFVEKASPLEDDSLLELLPESTVEGHTTELCPGIRRLLEEIHGAFLRGVVILIDYGMPATDYFGPERAEGTLRCYRQHRATDNPFEAVGHTDITAQVNFSHVCRFARETGFRILGYTDQNRFLTGIAQPWLLEMEGQRPSPEVMKEIHQFQTLTQPGNMGRLFKVLVLGKGSFDIDMDGLKWVDTEP